MAVGVTIFIILLVLKSCASQNSSQTTGSPTTTVSVAPNVSTITNSSRTTSTQHGTLPSTLWASTTSTVTTSTARTTTERAMHASLTQTSPTTKATITTTAMIHSPSKQYTSTTFMQAYVTTMNKSDNDTDSSNQKTTPTSISPGISTVSHTATETTDRMTNLMGILSQSTNLSSNESTTIILSTLLLRTVSRVTPPAGTRNRTTEKEKDKGLEKEVMENLGYDRDLVIIFGTMLSLMLVASIGYGIFKCNRRLKNKQFREGGGAIDIATSQF